MRILIIKTSSLGDIIHALPVLDYLHRAEPGIIIDWVVEEGFADLLEGNPLLNQVYTVRTKAWRKKPFSQQTREEVSLLKKQLRPVQYDLLFDLQGNLKSGLLALISGVKRRIGFPRQLMQEKINAFFINEQAPYSPENNHGILRQLSIVSVPFRLPYRDLELTADVAVSVEDKKNIDDLLQSLPPGRRFLFHCGTTWQTKFWSVESWGQLGQRVCEEYSDANILLSWGNQQERKMAEEIANLIGGHAHLLEYYPLKTLTALLKQVDLVSGGDTGLVHLAAVMGTPTVSFYRSSDGSESGPRGNQHVIVQSGLPCTRCFKTSCPKDSECRASITVDAMLAGIKKLIPLQ